METSFETSREKVNYGRKGEGHIDLKAAAEENMKKLREQKMPEGDFVDLRKELDMELGEEEESEPTADELEAVAKKLEMQYKKIEGARENIKFPGLNDAKRKELEVELEDLKEMAIKDGGITEEMYMAIESDNDDMKRAKNMLRTRVEYIKGI